MFRSRRVAFASRTLYPLVLRLGVAGFVVVTCVGCASQQARHAPPARVAGPAMASADDRHWRVEIEEDGLPAQLAPKHRRATPDDPSEPWSPNYGSQPAGRAAAGSPAEDRLTGPAPASRAGPDPLPGRTREAPPARRPPPPPPSRTASFDEEALIRRAIAEHEMRRRD